MSLYDSGWLSFGVDEDTPVVLNHNLGQSPVMFSLTGDDAGTEGFPEQLDGNGDPIPTPYTEQDTDPNTIKVYKLDAYTYSGNFKLEIID